MAFGDSNFSFGRRRGLPPLTEEEEQSLLGQIGQSALTGISWLGNVLDTPGSVARGLLAGDPGRAFGGITDWDQRVRGTELLSPLLGTDRDTPLFSAGGIAGLGAELATDPLFFANFGSAALTNLGKAARKAGVLPKTGTARAAGLARGTDEAARLAKSLSRGTREFPEFAGRMPDDILSEISGQSLGGNVGFGLPFGLGPQITADASPLLRGVGQAIGSVPVAGPLLGRAGQALAPLGRAAGALFQAQNKGALSEGGQKIAQAQFAGEAGARLAGHSDLMDLLSELPGGIKGFDQSEQAAIDLSNALERYKGQALPPELAHLEPFRQRYTDLMSNRLRQAQAAGFNIDELDDPLIGFLTRRVNPEVVKPKFGRQPLAPEEFARREKILKGIPTRGERSLNELFADATVRTPDEWAERIRTTYQTGWDQQRFDALSTAKATGQKLAQADAEDLARLEALRVQSEHLAEYKLQIGQTQRYYSNHPLEDVFDYLTRWHLKTLNAKELHKGIASLAQRGPAPGTVPLAKVLEEAGLTYTPRAGVTLPTPQAMERTLEELRKTFKDPSLTMADLKDFYVPEGVAQDVGRMVKPMVAPAALKPFIDIWDGITNLTKTAQTALWPAHKARNQMTAAFQHFIHGMYDPTVTGGAANPLAWVKPWTDAKALRAGKMVEGLEQIPDLAHLSAKDALEAIQREIVGLDIPGRGMQQSADVVGGQDFGRRLSELIPGQPQETLRGQFGKLKGRPLADWNPLNVRGVGNRLEDTNPLAQLGRGVDTVLDDTNRIAAYLAKRKQGFTPEAARVEMLKAHFDYSALTPFEKSVMRRAVPFYSWSRLNTAAMLKELATRPGGGVGTSIRLASKARGDAMTPPHVGAGVAIPLAAEAPGTARYLSSFGLPFEEAFTPFTNPLQGTLGQLNPIAKYPLEQLTGRQFFTGRNLEDLYSRTGAAQPVENALMNSPLGRFISTGGTLLDERKGLFPKALNVLTGARITDVDVEKTANRLAREVLEDELRGAGGRMAQNLFIPQDVLATLSPEQLNQYRLYTQLRNRARQAAQAAQR